MKKVILTLTAILSLVACEKAPTTTELAEQAVVESLLDPQSWEGISSEISDSLTQSDVDSIKLKDVLSIVHKYQDKAEDALEMCDLMVSTRNKQKYINEAKANLKVVENLMKEKVTPMNKAYKELRGSENDTLVKVVVKVNGYATSRDGQRRIGTFEVEMSPNNDILSTKSI